MAEYVNVELDDTRRLLIDLKAAKALDRVCGEVGLITINRQIQSFNIPTLERVLWAALLHEEPTLTISLVGKRVERYYEVNGTLAPLFMVAAEALDKSGLFNLKSEEPEGNAPKTATTTA